eukprot:m.62339 g.62339  ORF g.62339 m.62339 type:complete len:143 (+) comp8027_c0_seq1:105-533(+)
MHYLPLVAVVVMTLIVEATMAAHLHKQMDKRELEKMSMEELKLMLLERGQLCHGCVTKEDFVKEAHKHHRFAPLADKNTKFGDDDPTIAGLKKSYKEKEAIIKKLKEVGGDTTAMEAQQVELKTLMQNLDNRRKNPKLRQEL